MNSNIKNLLGVTLIVGILAFAYGVISYTGTYSDTIGLSARSFSVDGVGKITVVPDVAQFTFGVITEGGENLSDLQGQNATRVNRVIDFLKDSGIDEVDIETRRLNISPRYQRFDCFGGRGVVCPPAEIVGYTIDQSVRVKVRDLDSVGDVFAGVIENGANTASNLLFVVDDPTEFENQARAEAIADAERKARAVADASGVRVGKLLSIDEISQSPRFDFALSSAEGIGGGVVPPTIEPGTQEIIINVTLRYQIK